MNFKKSFSKKWYEWYEGGEYQQVIHRFVIENGTRMVRRSGCLLSRVVYGIVLYWYYREGEGRDIKLLRMIAVGTCFGECNKMQL